MNGPKRAATKLATSSSAYRVMRKILSKRRGTAAASNDLHTRRNVFSSRFACNLNTIERIPGGNYTIVSQEYKLSYCILLVLDI